MVVNTVLKKVFDKMLKIILQDSRKWCISNRNSLLPTCTVSINTTIKFQKEISCLV